MGGIPVVSLGLGNCTGMRLKTGKMTVKYESNSMSDVYRTHGGRKISSCSSVNLVGVLWPTATKGKSLALMEACFI